MQSSEPTDEELAAAVVAGDLAAFDALMRRYERLVFHLVAAAGGSRRGREDALDLTQTVFLKAYRGLSSFRGEASFKTWLLRIAHREGLNASRTLDRRGSRQDLDELDASEPVLARSPVQETDLVAAERLRTVRRAIGALGGRYRTAIRLRYLHQWPIKEIARVLDTSEGMTKNILFRGVRSLRRAVEEMG